MTALFYILLIPTVLTGLLFFFKTVTGTARGHSSTEQKITTVIASLILLGGGYYGWELSEKQGRPGLGAGVLIVSWLVFVAIMLISGLRNTKSWN